MEDRSQVVIEQEREAKRKERAWVKKMIRRYRFPAPKSKLQQVLDEALNPTRLPWEKK